MKLEKFLTRLVGMVGVGVVFDKKTRLQEASQLADFTKHIF